MQRKTVSMPSNKYHLREGAFNFGEISLFVHLAIKSSNLLRLSSFSASPLEAYLDRIAFAVEQTVVSRTMYVPAQSSGGLYDEEIWMHSGGTPAEIF